MILCTLALYFKTEKMEKQPYLQYGPNLKQTKHTQCRHQNSSHNAGTRIGERKLKYKSNYDHALGKHMPGKEISINLGTAE